MLKKADLKFKTLLYLHKDSLFVYLLPIFYEFPFFKNNSLCSDWSDGFLIPFGNIFVCFNVHGSVHRNNIISLIVLWVA
jgi:hypothetical protein